MKHKHGIRFRMIAITIMVVMAMTVMAFSHYYSSRVMQDQIDHAKLFERQALSLQKILTGLTEYVLIPDTPQAVSMVRTEIANFDNTLHALTNGSHDQLAVILESRIRPDWKEVKVATTDFLKISRPNPEDVETMIAFGRLSGKTNKLIKVMTQIKEEYERKSRAHLVSHSVIVGVIAVALIVITAVVMTTTFRTIAVPLEAITGNAETISAGKLNLDLAIKRDDEIGMLADSFRKMASSLRQMIGQAADISVEVNQAAVSIAATTHQVVDSVRVQSGAIEKTSAAIAEVDLSISHLKTHSNQLTAAASSTSSAAAELAASTKQSADNADALDSDALKAVENLGEITESATRIAASIQSLSRFSEETCQSMAEISSGVKNVQKSASRSVELAEQVSTSASEHGMQAIRDARSGFENISKTVSELTRTVNVLGSRSQEVGNIITVIQDIAAQTRLLALNASILAAQAGQHGKGFAVVADEIRSLADRTYLSTNQIIEVITSVQAETHTSIKMAKAGMNAVQQGDTLIERVKAAFESIHTDSLASTEMSRTIFQETILESEIIDRINDSIITLRDQINDISVAVHRQKDNTDEMTRSMEYVKASSYKIAMAMRDQSLTTEEISRISNDLLHQSEEISRSINVQKQEIDAIVAAIGNIHEASLKVSASAQAIDQATDSLAQKASTLTKSIKRFEV